MGDWEENRQKLGGKLALKIHEIGHPCGGSYEISFWDRSNDFRLFVVYNIFRKTNRIIRQSIFLDLIRLLLHSIGISRLRFLLHSIRISPVNKVFASFRRDFSRKIFASFFRRFYSQ